MWHPDPINVLVVEDNDLVRFLAVDHFEEEGFKVFEAGSADDAVGMLEKNPQIGILFTDVNMPGSMDGMGLAHFAKQHWPSLEIIVTSGRSYPSLPLPEHAVFLLKPYRMDHVAQLARRIGKRIAA